MKVQNCLAVAVGLLIGCMADPDTSSDGGDNAPPATLDAEAPAPSQDATRPPADAAGGDAAPDQGMMSGPADQGPVDPPALDAALDMAPTPGVDCGACSACGAYAETCAETCEAIHSALEPQSAAQWWACVAENACSPERPWTCFDDLACDSEWLVGDHCDALVRCAEDGRGFFEEESCRADPYLEPRRWSCLEADRREAVSTCLSSTDCSEMEMCISNAACRGEPGCMRVMKTRLVIDCHRISFDNLYGCGQGPERFQRCMNHCDEPAFHLADSHRRTVEEYALGEKECALDAVSRISFCAAALVCDSGRLAAALDETAARCGAQPEARAELHRWACLGEVILVNIERCLADAACGEVGVCLQTATCGERPACLAFMGELTPPEEP